MSSARTPKLGRRCLRDHLHQIRLLPAKDWPSMLRPPLSSAVAAVADTSPLPITLPTTSTRSARHDRPPPRHLRCPPPCELLRRQIWGLRSPPRRRGDVEQPHRCTPSTQLLGTPASCLGSGKAAGTVWSEEMSSS